jgi:hypothetical protein
MYVAKLVDESKSVKISMSANYWIVVPRNISLNNIFYILLCFSSNLLLFISASFTILEHASDHEQGEEKNIKWWKTYRHTQTKVQCYIQAILILFYIYLYFDHAASKSVCRHEIDNPNYSTQIGKSATASGFGLLVATTLRLLGRNEENINIGNVRFFGLQSTGAPCDCNADAPSLERNFSVSHYATAKKIIRILVLVLMV